jgi:hypothetical protein
LSTDVTCGLVERSAIPTIILNKIKMILLCVAAQSISEIEDLSNNHKSSKLSPEQYKEWYTLQRNSNYLVEMIEPMVLKLKLFEGFQKPLRFSAIMAAYNKLAEELRPLENYIVCTYNSEPQLSNLGVEWNEGEKKYIKVEQMD